VNPVQPPRATQLFVVHVWRRRTRFRASVRRVDDEQTVLFTSPTQLARYLSATCDDAGDAGPDTPAAPTTPRGELT
jgi:hypothetical protein